MKVKYCNVILTPRCFLKCKMCYMWRTGRDYGLPAEPLKAFMSTMKNTEELEWIVDISGGEPLIREDLVDILSFASSRGFKPNITTNAYRIDEKTAGRLIDAGISVVTVSIDSLKDKTHDFIRGVDGSLKRALAAIGYLRKKSDKVKIIVNTLIMRVNLDDIIELTEWAGGNVDNIHFQAIGPPIGVESTDFHWHRDKRYDFLWPDDVHKVHDVIDRLIRMKVDGFNIANSFKQFKSFKEYFRFPVEFIREAGQCDIYKDSIFIKPDGKVHLCCGYPPIGDIYKNNMQDILQSPSIKEVKDMIHACRNNCIYLISCHKDFDE